MKEMEVLKSLHHPNIVEYIGMEHEGDVTNIFLE
jgi:serine/threonine protein kinase